jgi:hypothetical protein
MPDIPDEIREAARDAALAQATEYVTPELLLRVADDVLDAALGAAVARARSVPESLDRSTAARVRRQVHYAELRDAGAQPEDAARLVGLKEGGHARIYEREYRRSRVPGASDDR